MVVCVSNTAVTKTDIVNMHILHAIKNPLDVNRVFVDKLCGPSQIKR